jgi:hypothetical protein
MAVILWYTQGEAHMQEKTPRAKRSTSFRLSGDAMALIEALAKSLGIDKSSVVEIAIRKLASAEGVRQSQ